MAPAPACSSVAGTQRWPCHDDAGAGGRPVVDHRHHGLLVRWLRLFGAACLIWLGWKLIRSSGGFAQPGHAPAPRGVSSCRACLVLSESEALLWFGAFIPQFVDPTGNYVESPGRAARPDRMAAAAISDGGYAVLAGRAGLSCAPPRVLLVSRVSGVA
jgi:threonine/homoserine/homoserine lactone efflux protein